MKFNRTLSFDGSRELECEAAKESGSSKTRRSVPRLENGCQATAKNHILSAQNLQPLDPQLAMTQEFSPSFVGLAGVFLPIKNDFTPIAQTQDNEDELGDDLEGLEEEDHRGQYSDASHWPVEKREKVRRVRFIICCLALTGIALAVMSRLMLNVTIVEMVKKQTRVEPEPSTVPPDPVEDLTEDLASLINSNDPLLFAATYEPLETQDTDTTEASASTDASTGSGSARDESHTRSDDQMGEISETKAESIVSADTEDDVQQYDWSKQDVNMILGSLYMGLIPGILLSGDLAQRYGAKYPLFACVFGSGLINMLTPAIASTSLNLMIVSRILLGLIQGSLLPSMYELFNRWLTKTESSIFAPLIKVSMPLGALIGTLMPGLLARYKLAWPLLFYIGGLFCLLWSLVWLFVATSFPQTNRFVGQSELNRIMRKKSAALKIIELPPPASQRTFVMVEEAANEKGRRSLSKAVPQMDFKQQAGASRRRKTPWLKIVTNPSVLVLMVTKFTYNVGIDFIMLQLAIYLREIHKAPIETISSIASSGYLMQMVLIAVVGWLAKTVVFRRTFGLSVTKWRKVFQGGANFAMAACYLLLAYTKPNIDLASVLLLAICFFWMLGAGGESMVPYDLSTRFTAPIVGFSHSVSMTSGLALTAIIGLVLAEDTQDPNKWSLLFTIVGSLLAVGGLLLICILKAKPFLEEEKQKAREQAAAGAVASKANNRPTAQIHHIKSAQ